MRNTATLQLLILAIVYAACFAHALPSQQLGPELNQTLGTSTVEGPTVELDSVPVRPSESFLRQMAWHNAPLSRSYPPWNLTDLGEMSCREVAERLSSEPTADPRDSSCTPSYSCNWDRLRYPHWLIFANCSQGPCDLSSDSMCLPYEDWMVVARFFEVDRSSATINAPTTGEAGEREEAKQSSAQAKGEWRLWRIPVSTDCLCVQ